MIAVLKSDDRIVFIGSGYHVRTTYQGFELLSADIHGVLIGIDQDDDIKAPNDGRFQQPPALRNDSPRTIAFHGVTVMTHRNKNGAGFRAAVSQDVETHPLGGPAASLIEHPGNIASRPDTLPLPEAEAGSAPFVVRHGNQYFFFSLEMLSLARPFARRLFRTSRPLLVFMRALNPNFRTRRVLLG